MDEQRSLLDQLMGRDRNRALDADPNERLRWNDPSVCIYYLQGFCPYQLFHNTKADLGPCLKVHDSTLTAEYEKQHKNIHRRYNYDFLKFLERIISDLEKRIERHETRLELPAPEHVPQSLDPDFEAKQNEILRMDKEIEILSKKVEENGTLGNVDNALHFSKEIEILKARKSLISQSMQQMAILLNGNQSRLQICEICGALLVENDVQSRVIAHLEGKIHTGYILIREKIQQLREKSMNNSYTHINKNKQNRNGNGSDGKLKRIGEKDEKQKRLRYRSRSRSHHQHRHRSHTSENGRYKSSKKPYYSSSSSLKKRYSFERYDRYEHRYETDVYRDGRGRNSRHRRKRKY